MKKFVERSIYINETTSAVSVFATPFSRLLDVTLVHNNGVPYGLSALLEIDDEHDTSTETKTFQLTLVKGIHVNLEKSPGQEYVKTIELNNYTSNSEGMLTHSQSFWRVFSQEIKGEAEARDEKLSGIL